MKRLLLFALLISPIGCTSASCSQVTSLGSQHTIQVYSGGVMVAEFTSTGKVMTEEHSDGWFFTDKDTGKLVRVSGTVVVKQK